MARPNRQVERRSEIMDAAIALDRTARPGHAQARRRRRGTRTDDKRGPLLLQGHGRSCCRSSPCGPTSASTTSGSRLVERTDDVPTQLAMTMAAGLPTGSGGRRMASDLAGRSGRRVRTGSARRRARDLPPAGRASTSGSAHRGREGRRVPPRAQPARDIAMTVMSMEDYFGYRIVARDPALDRRTALRLMREYAELATGARLPSTL